MEKNYVKIVEVVLQEDLAYQHGSKKNYLMRLIYKAIDNEYYSRDIVKLLSETYESGISGDHKDVVKLILAIKSSNKGDIIADQVHIKMALDDVQTKMDSSERTYVVL
ncbi:hypothetical protein POM88_019757 [Heracleum sosnowskyi]|uniref:Uncharacterized protein n=1 Tax=Heracleum sosnowskyi TaxID=360622 RepID=A0AAD8MR53_9APIA|nr:hypothetical protein POM88_019757 [Heracleum sosnowskyi]